MKFATVLPSGLILLRKGPWSEEIPPEALPSRVALYRWGAARAQGKYRQFYQPELEELLSLARTLGIDCAERPQKAASRSR